MAGTLLAPRKAAERPVAPLGQVALWETDTRRARGWAVSLRRKRNDEKGG